MDLDCGVIIHRISTNSMLLLRRSLTTSASRQAKQVTQQFSKKPKKLFTQVKCVSLDPELDLKDFNSNAPVRFKKIFRGYPAIAKWFIRPPPEAKITAPPKLNAEYLEQFGTTVVPLELTRARGGTTEFERFDAPLSLLLSHMTGPDESESHLYLAQHALADLPAGMQEDLPTPEVLKHLGKGDIYASSLWMGRPPTRTPLHRDPNHNLFIQLSGKKTVRLLRPEVGQEVYERVRVQVGKSSGSASMRGEEMMQGKELKALEAAVWDKRYGGSTESKDTEAKGLEIELASGDGLYIPMGWWHAVHGIGTIPNVSVWHSAEIRSKTLTIP